MLSCTIKRWILRVFCFGWLLTSTGIAHAADLEVIAHVEAQPLAAQLKRVADALGFLGQPLTDAQQAELSSAIESNDAEAMQRALDPLVLAGVYINPEQRVKVARGAAEARLIEQGWSVYLVKVHNEAGITPQLKVESPNAERLVRRSSGQKRAVHKLSESDVAHRWMDLQMFDKQPMVAQLSGLEVEYRIVQLYSRDRGKREASLSFHVGQGSQDIGFRNDLAVLFECAAAVEVTLDIVDHNGEPTTGQFEIRDGHGRVYPARSKRLAPDFFFHDQIYRHSGETVSLPAGEYEIKYTRGPEYRIDTKTIHVPAQKTHRESFRLRRWIKLVEHGWFSGDHHVHAAGCAHYEAPTEGVTPEAMMRHILGEDLNVGCVLSWGPCWYYQKEFFEGQTNQLSSDEYLMRYDVEVSGFPSQSSGHLCLLRLADDDYTYPEDMKFDYSFGPEKGTFEGRRTKLVGEWPSWDYPILKWGKEQGGVVGFSHSGWGLAVEDETLPSYDMPKFDGIGANEYIVDVVHDVCDFISAVDTPIVWELSIWYHTLNCGYQCPISGETDFPCIYGDRVGLGRAYVKLADQPLTFDNWVFGIRDGRSYCSDGLSHLYDFSVNDLGVGEKGKDGRPGVLATGDHQIRVKVAAAALLNEQPNEEIRNRPLAEKPYWHVERARVGNSRKVPVELIVNGQSVARQEIEADGEVNELQFDYQLKRSSWVALRIFPTAHTNPVFVEIDGKPIRASKRSAQWCREAVEVCWKSKQGGIRSHEQDAATAVYDVARAAYDQIIQESFDDTQ